jgi:GT2 family glycosyltransferase
MKLHCTILNYKTPDLAIRSLHTLLKELDGVESYHVDVVDNDSQDGSFDQIEQAVKECGQTDRVTAIASPKNGGFAYGNNIAIRRNLESDDPAEYFYILNSDAFPDEGAVKCLLDFLENHRHVGIAGSYIHGVDGNPHITAFRFPNLLSELEAGIGLGAVTNLVSDWLVSMPLPDRTCQVDWLAGASMMIRRVVFDKVGLLDENFFLYFEETDLCRRALLAGYPTFYVRDSSVTHIGSVSTGMQDKSNRLPSYWFDSRRYYFEKNHGKSYLWAANALWSSTYPLYRIKRLLQRKETRTPPRWWRDFVRHTLSSRSDS